MLKPIKTIERFAHEVSDDNRDHGILRRKAPFFGEIDSLQSSISKMIVLLDIRHKNAKESEQALERSRATLKQVLDATPQSIFWKDKDGTYLGCNSVFSETLGLDDHDVVTRTDIRRNIIEPLQLAEGEQRTVRTTKVPLVDSQGEVYGVLGTYEDITEGKRAEEARERLQIQLGQTQKMEAIGTLARGIAHNFNNILSIILGNIEVALSDDDPKKHRQDLEKAIKATKRARELVQQILAFSRKTDPQKVPLQLSLVVKETLKMLRSTISTISVRDGTLGITSLSRQNSISRCEWYGSDDRSARTKEQGDLVPSTVKGCRR